MDAIDHLDPRDPEIKARSDAVLAKILDDLGGKPALSDYQRVDETLRIPWPGDDQIRQLYPVAP